MNPWSVVWRIIDAALGIAIAADERKERRKVQKQLGELGSAMRRDEQRLERAKVPTVPPPRRPPPPTSQSAVAAPAKPSAPNTPPRRR